MKFVWEKAVIHHAVSWRHYILATFVWNFFKGFSEGFFLIIYLLLGLDDWNRRYLFYGFFITVSCLPWVVWVHVLGFLFSRGVLHSFANFSFIASNYFALICIMVKVPNDSFVVYHSVVSTRETNGLHIYEQHNKVN